jgi:hypothetical protein
VNANAAQQKIQGFKMPPDRDMDATDKADLIKLIYELDSETHQQ